MTKGEVCFLTTLDDEKVVLTNTVKEQYVVDIDTYIEKKESDIKVGDLVLMVIDGRQENADGTFTPNVISIEYRERDPRKVHRF